MQQTQAAAAFVEIVETLVNDFDVIDVLTVLSSRCIELLDAAAVGILLADGDGHLRVVGASTERVELLELFQVQNDQGPCLDCYTTGHAIAAPDLNGPCPWPQFAIESVRAGYQSVYALPLRLSAHTLGCLNLFMSLPGPLSKPQSALAQAMADVASIAIVQHHSAHEEHGIEIRLRHALDGRAVIEQAKGIVAEQRSLEMHDAFDVIRAFAHDNHRALTEVATEMVAGTLSLDDFDSATSNNAAEPAAMLTDVSFVDGRRVVRISGELDISTRDTLFHASVGGDTREVEIDLSALTFLDCAGYDALVAIQIFINRQGGVLTLSNAVAQPDYLLKRLDIIGAHRATSPNSFVPTFRMDGDPQR